MRGTGTSIFVQNKPPLSKMMPLKKLLCGTALFTVPGITERINTLEVATTERKKKKKKKKRKEKPGGRN